MELKSWLFAIRIINIMCTAMMVGFQIWYIVELINMTSGFFGFFIRVFTPVCIILLAFMILSAQFKYQKVVEYFKFLQSLIGLALFNLFIASIMAFQFSTVDDLYIQYLYRASILVPCSFVLLTIVLFVMSCLKPVGTEGLLNME